MELQAMLFAFLGVLFYILVEIRKVAGPGFSPSYWMKRNGWFSFSSLLIAVLLGYILPTTGQIPDVSDERFVNFTFFCLGAALDPFLKTFKPLNNGSN